MATLVSSYFLSAKAALWQHSRQARRVPWDCPENRNWVMLFMWIQANLNWTFWQLFSIGHLSVMGWQQIRRLDFHKKKVCNTLRHPGLCRVRTVEQISRHPELKSINHFFFRRTGAGARYWKIQPRIFSRSQVLARKKVAYTVLAFVVIFGVCYLPYHVFMLWFYFK